jgi:hypothetical protein
MSAAHFTSSTQFASRPLSIFSKRQLHSSGSVSQESASQSAEVPAPTPSYIVPESFAVVYVGGRQYKVSKGINPPLNLFAQSQEFYQLLSEISSLQSTFDVQATPSSRKGSWSTSARRFT